MYKKFFILSVLILGAGCSSNKPAAPPIAEVPVTQLQGVKGIPFSITYKGIKEETILGVLKSESSLEGQGVLPPFSTEDLRVRAEKEVPQIKKILSIWGYFNATVRVHVEEDQDDVSRVIFDIEKGQVAKLRHLLIEPAPFGPPIDGQMQKRLVKAAQEEFGASAEVSIEKVKEVGEFLVQWLQNRGYPFALMDRKEVILPASNTVADVLYVINLGPFKTFGPLKIEKFDGISEEFIRQEILWTEGEPYDERLVQKSRQKLYYTGLFDSISITYDKKADQKAAPVLPMELTVTKALDRVVGGGLKYMTSTGAGVKGFWRSLNLLGNAETLDITGEVSKKRQGLNASFVRPNFLQKKQSLIIKGEYEKEHPAAYHKRGASGLVSVKRTLARNWRGSVGVSYEQARLEKESKRSSYHLTGFPLSLAFDNTKPKESPIKGVAFSIHLTPFPANFGAARSFIKVSFREVFVLPLDQKETVSLKLWSSQGLMPGGSMVDVPASKRFYLGGERSLRAYGYQKAGPLDKEKAPLGGRSYLDGGVEIKYPYFKDLDGVLFYEAGSVFTRNHPNFRGRFFSGAGSGVRYKTSVGVLKLDMGVPFYRRRKIDDLFQLYFGIGTTF